MHQHSRILNTYNVLIIRIDEDRRKIIYILLTQDPVPKFRVHAGT